MPQLRNKPVPGEGADVPESARRALCASARRASAWRAPARRADGPPTRRADPVCECSDRPPPPGRPYPSGLSCVQRPVAAATARDALPPGPWPTPTPPRGQTGATADRGCPRPSPGDSRGLCGPSAGDGGLRAAEGSTRSRRGRCRRAPSGRPSRSAASPAASSRGARAGGARGAEDTPAERRVSPSESRAGCPRLGARGAAPTGPPHWARGAPRAVEEWRAAAHRPRRTRQG